MKRKLFTLLFSLVMILTMIPVYTGVAYADTIEISEINMSIDYSKLKINGTYEDLAKSIESNLTVNFGDMDEEMEDNYYVGLSLYFLQDPSKVNTYDIYPHYFEFYENMVKTLKSGDDGYEYYNNLSDVMKCKLDGDDTLKIAVCVSGEPYAMISSTSFVTKFNGKVVEYDKNLGWSAALESSETIAIEGSYDYISYFYLKIGSGSVQDIIEEAKKADTQTSSLYLPDPYVEAIDGTLHKSSEVNFYNAELHQKEVASIKEAAKDWTTQCRTKVAKKGIRTYCYLDGLATEELYSYIDKGYTVTYDWYRADGKGKKFKYVDSTDKYTYLDSTVKKGKYYEYKVKVNLWDEDGNIYKTTLADCTKGFRTFK